jgi:hypothetical protein
MTTKRTNKATQTTPARPLEILTRAEFIERLDDDATPARPRPQPAKAQPRPASKAQLIARDKFREMVRNKAAQRKLRKGIEAHIEAHKRAELKRRFELDKAIDAILKGSLCGGDKAEVILSLSRLSAVCGINAQLSNPDPSAYSAMYFRDALKLAEFADCIEE